MKTLLFSLRALLLPFILAVCSTTGAHAAPDTPAPVPLPPGPMRPDAAAGPTKISVALWVSDVTKIDSVAQTFTANVVMFLRWHDSRLAHSGPDVKQFATSEIWHPEWVIMNQSGAVDRSLPERVKVAPDGTAIYHQRLGGVFSQAHDLSRFPFDEGKFRIHFLVPGYRPGELEFVPESTAVLAGIKNGAGMASELSLQDWKVLSYTARPQCYQPTPAIEVAGYAFEFTAKRNTQHFVIKVILPLLFIVMMSWAVFWLEPSETGPQIGLAVTTMLTLIAYRFALDSEVPKVPYVTRLDSFVLVSTFLVFLSLIEVLVTTKLSNAGNIALARRVDFHSRWAFPLVFATHSLVNFCRP